MRDRAWSRRDSIFRLRHDIWRYVTEAARTDDDVLLIAAALLQMPRAEVRYLAELQFILSDEVGRLLEQMPLLIRPLTTTSVAEVETSTDRIRGAIRWGETFAQRAATGYPHLFVTAPTRRAFETPENAVLAFALRAVAESGTSTRWHESTVAGPAQLVRERVAESTRWHQARPFTGLGMSMPSATMLGRVRASCNRRRYQAALDVVDLYRRFVARLNRRAIREVIEKRALIASRDSVLLEMECMFDTIRTLREQGWHAAPDALIRPPLIFNGERGVERVELFFQAAPRALTAGSRYREVQWTHRFPTASSLIPDFVLRVITPDVERWALIEVKGGTERSVADSARAATLDLLAYRRAFGPTLGRQTGPYGLGYAWGAELEPASGSEIVLCTPDTLPTALKLLVKD